MSVIIQPQADFPITRQLTNHLDAGTYYVRAVIRDADDSLIERVNLTDQGEQRFSKKWHSVADGTGQGRYVSIVTSVYTDSGYTTKSENYGDEENTYLVFDRVLPTLRVGAGGGVDSRTVRRIIQEELENLPKPEKPEPVTFPTPEKVVMKWDEVFAQLGRIQTELESIPKDTVNLSPVISRLNDLAEIVELKPVTPETDLTPVIELLSDTKEETRLDNNEMKDFLRGVEDTIADKVVEAVKDTIGKTNFTTSFVTQATQDKAPNQEPLRREEVKKSFDIRKLAV